MNGPVRPGMARLCHPSTHATGEDAPSGTGGTGTADAGGRDGAAVSEPPVRVVVVDDDEHVRAALREIIDAQLDLQWVGQATDAASAAEACQQLQPDVAVMDLRIPGGGAVATRAVREHCPDVAIVAHSAFGDRPHREQMLSAGASSYVTKGSPGQQLLDAIRRAAARRGSQG